MPNTHIGPFSLWNRLIGRNAHDDDDDMEEDATVCLDKANTDCIHVTRIVEESVEESNEHYHHHDHHHHHHNPNAATFPPFFEPPPRLFWNRSHDESQSSPLHGQVRTYSNPMVVVPPLVPWTVCRFPTRMEPHVFIYFCVLVSTG